MVIHSLLIVVITTSCVNLVLGGAGNGPQGGPQGSPQRRTRTRQTAPINNIKDTSISHLPTRCFPDKVTGRCRAHMPKYFFNTKTGQCESFIYGGCGGNDNRFDTLPGCHRTCTCKTEAESGPCRGHMRRWFYSAVDGCCRPFIYGGCGGNSNNYDTWTECSELCGYPTMDSKFWQWGLDWLKWLWQQQQDQTSGTTPRPIYPNHYTKDDFIRDWVLWGLLTGGEGELEMEEMATMIAQAHILGFGQASGVTGAGTATATGTGTANMQGNYTMADTHAALKYFQRHFGGEATENGNGMIGGPMGAMMGGAFGGAMGGAMGRANGGAMGGAMSGSMGGAAGGAIGGAVGAMTAKLGPAYSIARPGSFTPLGAMGTADNYINIQSLGGEGGLGGGMTGNMNSGVYSGLNQWGQGQFGQTYMSNQQRANTNQNQQRLGANQQRHLPNQQQNTNQAGWQALQGGLQSIRQGQQSNQQRYQNSQQQQASSRRAGMRSLGNQAQWRGSWANARFQNMGNTREGWAPHLKGIPGLGTAAMEMFGLIRQLSNDNLNPFAFHNLARRYGALGPNGQVNMEKLAQRLVGSLTSSAGTAHVIGAAKSLGAVDGKGNIDFNKLMKQIGKSAGKGGLFGLNWGGTWEGRSLSGGTGIEMGGFGGLKRRVGSRKTARAMNKVNKPMRKVSNKQNRG